MIKIMFVCYGNICRSPMAEFIMKDYVEKRDKAEFFLIKSSATSSEELGNGVHRGTRRVLDRMGISYSGKVATKLRAEDYENYDYFIGMDENNRSAMRRILNGDKQNKVSLLMDYTDSPRDVADPYWTGDFEATESDVKRGIEAFYEYLIKTKKI